MFPLSGEGPEFSLVDGDVFSVAGIERPPHQQTVPGQENNSSVVHHVHSEDLKSFLMKAALSGLTAVMMYYVSKSIFRFIDPNIERKENELSIKARVLERLREQRGEGISARLAETNSFENRLMDEIIFPEQIDSSFEDIGGLEEHKNMIKKTILLPLTKPELFSRSGSSNTAPKGVLFWGPPGTGKTMMAKAISKSANATFLNLRLSTLQDKWFGESLKLVRAVFSLAEKLAPTIVFIDEIDSFLQDRTSLVENEASLSMKTEFMLLWDGLLSQSGAYNSQVLVLGATNRPEVIDKAILRRLPRRIEFKLPTVSERRKILEIILKDEEEISSTDIDYICALTESYSGSDLKELVKMAFTYLVDECDEDEDIESLTVELIEKALQYVKPATTDSFR